jgi:fumarylacetoacetase
MKTKTMEKADQIVTTNYKYMYWSCAQQLSHHSVTGCNMQPGDLLGSGTISGPEKHEFGSLLELTWGGVNSIALSNGENRKFIEDGDSVNIRGSAFHNGKRIGFGDCEGTVLPAFPESEYIS